MFRQRAVIHLLNLSIISYATRASLEFLLWCDDVEMLTKHYIQSHVEINSDKTKNPNITTTIIAQILLNFKVFICSKLLKGNTCK